MIAYICIISNFTFRFIIILVSFALKEQKYFSSGVKIPENKNIYDVIVTSVANYLQQEGFSSVKANTDGYPQPSRIQWDKEDKGVLPDITCQFNGSLYIFEVETRSQFSPEKVEDRWKLLFVHARRFEGAFYLVIPESVAEGVQEIVNELDIKPEFLKLRGIETG